MWWLTEGLLTTITIELEATGFGVYACEDCGTLFMDSDDDTVELEPWGKQYEMGNPMFDDSDLAFVCHPCVEKLREGV